MPCPFELALPYSVESSSILQLGNSLVGSASLSSACTVAAGAVLRRLSWHRKAHKEAHLHQMYLSWHRTEHIQKLLAAKVVVLSKHL